MATKSKSKKEQETKTSIFFDDKEYFFEDMSQEQQAMINHISDLESKIQKTQFDMNQHTVGKQAFIDMLQKSLEDSDS